jgi:hypothetical protein
MKELESLQVEHKHLANKRREAIIGIRQRYKIKVEGVSEKEVPEPIETFQKM